MRYFVSFFLTLILYASAITTFLYSFNNQTNTAKKEEKNSLVKISLIKPNEEKKEVKKILKPIKNEPKKIQKKVQKPKKRVIKKIVKTKTIEKKEIKKVIGKEELPQKLQKENIEPIQKKVDITKIKNDFILELKKTINKNKYYPNSARRRGIEGYVNVNFIIGKKGELKDIKILDGKKIFFKAAKEAIIKSFPINTKENNYIFPLKFDLCIKYNLN